MSESLKIKRSVFELLGRSHSNAFLDTRPDLFCYGIKSDCLKNVKEEEID
jgi:hypothetical protein